MAFNATDFINRSRNGLSDSDTASFPETSMSLQHKTLLLFSEYSIRTSPDSLNAEPVTANRVTGAITLPVPMEILEPYSVNYSPTNLGLSGASGAMVSQLGDPTFNAAFGVAGLAGLLRGAEAVNRMSVAGGILNRYGATNGVLTGAGRGFLAGLGVAINPYTVSTFKGVNLRVHKLFWKLSPENKRESEEIEKIIKILRAKMLPTPTLGFGNLFLSYPDLVTYRIYGARDERNITPIAPCAMFDLIVDRTGGDYPTFFGETGLPVVYSISLSLLELLPLLRKDRTSNDLDLISPILR